MAKIAVSAQQVTGPLNHFWQSTGFTPADLLLQPTMQQTLDYVGSTPYQGMQHVRIHFLLDLVSGSGIGTDTPKLNFSNLDEGIDAMQRNGLKPFFELMGNPSGYFSDFTDDAQLHAWKRLVRLTAEHLMDRYGKEEVESWYFETWNEPDVGWWPQWKDRNVKALCHYYDACSEGLREANPKLMFGGPGSAEKLSVMLKGLLEHIDQGKNYFTGDTVRCDFLSIHEKGGMAGNEPVDPDTRSIIEDTLEFIDYLHEHHPRLTELPLMNNECDPVIGWRSQQAWRVGPYYAVIAARIIDLHLREIIDKAGANFTFLSNDNGFLGGFSQRTQLANLSREASEKLGKVSLVKKPVLTVMSMLAMLGDERVAVEDGYVDVDSRIGCMATRRDSESQVALLVWHHTDRSHESGSETVELEIKGLPENSRLVHYRLDEAHGNAFAAWSSLSRKDQYDLRGEAKDKLAKAMELPLLEEPCDINGSEAQLSFELPLHSVSVLVFTADPGQAPPKVEGLTAREYLGASDDREIMLRWCDAGPRTVRTYEVLRATEEAGPYERVNPVDLVDTGYLHVAPAVAKAWYKVRAVDYWGRAGESSEPVLVE